MNKKICTAAAMLSAAVLSTTFPARGADPEAIGMDSVSIDGIVVTGSRVSTTSRNLPMSVSVITEGQLDRRLDQSVLPVLTEQVPGLFITSTGPMGYMVSNGSAGSISIRGSAGERNC